MLRADELRVARLERSLDRLEEGSRGRDAVIEELAGLVAALFPSPTPRPHLHVVEGGGDA